MKRRDVIRKILLGGSTLALMPAAFTRCSEEDFSSYPGVAYDPQETNLIIDLNNPDYAKLKNYYGHITITSKKMIIAHSGQNGYYAAQSQCTHNGCTLQFAADFNSGTIWRCPCHASGFDCTGKPICGPATANLKVYNVTRTGDILTIKG